MAVCRDLENLENIGSDRKSVLRARRTRRPKMVQHQKKQKFRISIRSARNVGKVVISREMGLKNSKHPSRAKISLISFSLNFGTQEGSPYRPPIGPLFTHKVNGDPRSRSTGSSDRNFPVRESQTLHRCKKRLEKQFREELASIRKKLNLITYDRYQNRGTATNLRGNLEKFSYSRDNN